MGKDCHDTYVDLLEVQELAYVPSGLTITHLKREAESQEYGACTFQMDHRRVKFRIAKITPTKIGQFVTLWKRLKDGPILPHAMEDPIDFFVVSVRTTEHFGQFVFPKAVLYKQGILSQDGKGGKLGIRVYPPWDITQNAQAKKTQAWQCLYFFDIKTHLKMDTTLVQKLFG